jgi:light-independent protochlorophyllide reductase subunit B
LFDTWIHPLMMGLEEHLIHMFRDDFEFHDGAAPSHLGHSAATYSADTISPAVSSSSIVISNWAAEAQSELNKIPFFVRGKARRNTERYAQERGVQLITVETLYDAKAHFSR